MVDLDELLRQGDYAGTRDWLRAAGAADLAGVRREVARLRRRVCSEPEGATGPDWQGELLGHHDATTLAHLACLRPDQAARLGAVSYGVALDIPVIHPDHLDVFVQVWSDLYQRNPRNWDRNAHYGAMFVWVERGLVSAPIQDGAVNLWLEIATTLVHPHAPPGPGEPAPTTAPTPEQCPELWTVTLPRLFEAQVAPGLGAAALDLGNGGQVQDLVVHLVGTGVWSREKTMERLDRALSVRERAFDRRWLLRLREALSC